MQTDFGLGVVTQGCLGGFFQRAKTLFLRFLNGRITRCILADQDFYHLYAISNE
jgi:hypothetical protein